MEYVVGDTEALGCFCVRLGPRCGLLGPAACCATECGAGVGAGCGDGVGGSNGTVAGLGFGACDDDD